MIQSMFDCMISLITSACCVACVVCCALRQGVAVSIRSIRIMDV